MNIDQQRYDARVIVEFQREIRDLLARLPDSAHVNVPPSENDYGKRVSFRLQPDVAKLSWEVDSPRIAGPLGGSGDLFGDQVLTPNADIADFAAYSATIRRRDGAIISWDGPAHNSDLHSSIRWLLTIVSSFLPGFSSLAHPSFCSPSPNDYSRATSVLRNLTAPPRLN